MADFPTNAELSRVFRNEALLKQSRLTKDALDRDGTDANAIRAGAGAVGDEVIGQLVRVQSGLYVDSARGQALDRLLFDRYGLRRKKATPARGTVEFSTSSATSASFSIPKDLKLKTADGRTYLTETSATFPSGSTGPVSVTVRSARAGLEQQARAGTITSIAGQVPGSPSDLAVTNPKATAGAANREQDEAYRERGRRFFQTARRGTLSAIEAGILGVDGVKSASVFEAIDSQGRPASVVQAVIADEFTEDLVDVTPTPASYQTQSQTLASRVFDALDEIRAAGIFVEITVAQVVLQGIQLALTFDAGVDVDTVAFRARATIVAYVNGLRPGDDLTINGMVEALKTVPGLVVTGSEIVSPAGDVQVETLEVVRTSLGLVSAVSVQPDRQLQGSTNPDA